MGSSLPPETPTRALLQRLHRRSSVLPTTASGHVPDHSLSLLGPPPNHRAARGAVLDDDSTEQEDSDETHCADETHAGDRSIVSIDDSATGQQDPQIRQLQWQIEELQMQKQEVEAELRKSRKKAREGVTWETARKLEREFEAQEMILKGLQRDNERRMIESERLHRKMRTMSDFLQQHHGEEWRELVFGSRIEAVPRDLGSSSKTEREKSSASESRDSEASSRDEAPSLDHESSVSMPPVPLPGQWMSPAHVAKTSGQSMDQPRNDVLTKSPGLGSANPTISAEEGNMTAVDASRWADAEASFDTTYADCSHTQAGNAPEEMSRNESTKSVLESEGKGPANDGSDDGSRSLRGITRATGAGKDQDIQDISQILAAASLQEPSQLQVKLQQPDETPSLKPPVDDLHAIRAQLEETRLLLEGFARRSARREMELIEMEERARIDLERGRETLEGVAERISCGAFH